MDFYKYLNIYIYICIYIYIFGYKDKRKREKEKKKKKKTLAPVGQIGPTRPIGVRPSPLLSSLWRVGPHDPATLLLPPHSLSAARPRRRNAAPPSCPGVGPSSRAAHSSSAPETTVSLPPSLSPHKVAAINGFEAASCLSLSSAPLPLPLVVYKNRPSRTSLPSPKPLPHLSLPRPCTPTEPPPPSAEPCRSVCRRIGLSAPSPTTPPSSPCSAVPHRNRAHTVVPRRRAVPPCQANVRSSQG
jgi:hypothetical protein